MALKVYNTMKREKEAFVPRREGEVDMYVCGVTVYDRSHIGHARCYVSFDVVYRFLKHQGLKVKYVRNFTDVDDKIIQRANETDVQPRDLATENIEAFHVDMDALGCLRPDLEPRVTDHIEEIVSTVKDIVDRGHGYVVDGTVYFSIETKEDYGKLSWRNLEDLKAGASDRVGDDPNKRTPLDFVLWKPAKPGEPSWDSPWGAGRPGWHIECSAMSMKHLGATFDIHGGGKDLIFPHHENEIAQSEAASGQEPFVRYWLHNGFVNVDQEKMSKSLGNFFTIGDVLERYHPQAVRLFLLGTHYRSPLNYSDRNLEEATARLEYFYETLSKVDAAIEAGGREGGEAIGKETLEGIMPRIVAAMSDDFNTALALGHLSEIMSNANDLVGKKRKTMGRIEALRLFRQVIREASSIFGVLDLNPVQALEEIKTLDVRRLGIEPEAIEQAIQDRTQARQDRDFEAADRLRNELLEKGIVLMDNPTGTAWKVAKKAGGDD